VESTIPYLSTLVPGALQTAMILAMAFWIWRADRVLLTLRLNLESLTNLLAKHDEWERDMREADAKERKTIAETLAATAGNTASHLHDIDKILGGLAEIEMARHQGSVRGER
jgi:hypothetical protein